MMMKALMIASAVDGELNDNEKSILFEIYTEKFHNNESDANEIIKEIIEEVQSGEIECEIPKDQVPELINNLAAVIAADGKITDEEENLILNVAKNYNFPEDTTIKIIQGYLTNNSWNKIKVELFIF